MEPTILQSLLWGPQEAPLVWGGCCLTLSFGRSLQSKKGSDQKCRQPEGHIGVLLELYRSYIGIMENKMEATGRIGIMEKKLETSI